MKRSWFGPSVTAISIATATITAAVAHNGFGIAPVGFAPTGIIVTDGSEPLVLSWTTTEFHDNQFYRLKFQAGDFPPTPSPPSAMREGETLLTLPADALSYEVPVDLSTLPSGVWRLYAEFDEPPFCVELEALPALVVMRRDGDPAPFGAMVTAPLADSPSVDTETTVSVEAIAPAVVNVTLEAGEIQRDPAFPENTLCVEFTWTPLFTVAENLTMVPDPAAGPDRWRVDYLWDTSEVPDGAYLFRVTVTMADGSKSVFWSRRWVNVEHPVPVVPPSEPGPEWVADAAPEAPETNDELSASGGCASGGGFDGSWWALAGLGFGCLAINRRRLAKR
jgi:hypothetical protein